MKNLLTIAAIVAILIAGYNHFFKHKSSVQRSETISSDSLPTSASEQFRCDGRTHCSQMHSCAEAKYFIQHCPNTKMDGNNDGIPCERQWCK